MLKDDDKIKHQLIIEELQLFYLKARNIGLPKDRALLDNIAENIIAKSNMLLGYPLAGRYAGRYN